MVHVMSTNLEHAYVRRTLDLLARGQGQVAVVPRGTLSRSMFSVSPPAVIHLHWIEPMMRGVSLPKAAGNMLRLLLYVTIMRFRGIRTVWTIHNLPGKSLEHKRLDVIVRSLLAMLSARLVVLNEAAREAAVLSFPAPFRAAFRGKSRVVPLPRDVVDHGKAIQRSDARSALGIASVKPVVGYFVATNQPDLTPRVVDPLVRSGCAFTIPRNFTPSDISDILDRLSKHPVTMDSYARYDAGHTDEVVSRSLSEVYAEAGLPLMCSEQVEA